MKKLLGITLLATILLSSCVSQKQHTALQGTLDKTKQDLVDVTANLTKCILEKEKANSNFTILQDQVSHLKKSNNALLENLGNMASLSRKEAENLEMSLENIKEKDLRIRSMQDAITRRDSVTLALVTSLKGVLDDINDPDIEINVEKGVVYVSLSDKLVFNTASFVVSDRAKEILGKVAKIVNAKPDINIMVEGHTDNVSIKNNVVDDNWDLSVKRATSVVRILQNDFQVAPERMTAAGRSSYVPVADNATDGGKSKNRRTRIIILPKLDEFYSLLEQGMKNAK
ncbi:MAG: OmpA family protein [Flavobacteriales bacterium]|jgi:chemotaxis protein MotB|nr:OmpA family protein [Flavobacteriales bacterium]